MMTDKRTGTFTAPVLLLPVRSKLKIESTEIWIPCGLPYMFSFSKSIEKSG